MYFFKICNCKNKTDNYLLRIGTSCGEDGGGIKICLYFVHIECEGTITEISINLTQEFKNQTILDHIQAFSPTKPKGIIFDTKFGEFFKKEYEFKEYFKDYCISNNIPYQFITKETSVIASILHGVNIDIKNTVTIIYTTLRFVIFIFVVKENGIFKIKTQKVMEKESAETELQSMAFKDIEKCEAIILAFDDILLTNVKKYQRIFASEKLVTLKGSYMDFWNRSMIAAVKNLNGIEADKFKFGAVFNGNLILSIQENAEPFLGNIYASCWNGFELPYTDSFEVLVEENHQLCVNANLTKSYECLKVFDMSEFASKNVCVQLDVDSNGFFTVGIEKITQVCQLPRKLKNQMVTINLSDSKMSLYISTIGLIKIDNFDSHLLPYISFSLESVFVGREAKYLYSLQPTFVVFDLLKLISILDTNAKPDPTWKFSIAKNSDGISQIIFDTFRGKRKATPQFLMAILIQHLLKLAKNELGFKPKSINIEIHRNYNTEKVQKVVDLSCKILNVNCNFLPKKLCC